MEFLYFILFLFFLDQFHIFRSLSRQIRSSEQQKHASVSTWTLLKVTKSKQTF